MKKLIFTLVLLWWCIVWLTPDAVGFRDSPELVLSARFLDVAHPPGYPLYSQLANLFTHISTATIAWRVNLFSGFLATCSVALIYLVTQELLKALSLNKLAWVSAVSLVVSPIFLRQVQYQEAYVFHLCICLLLIYLWLLFERTLDKRLLVLSSLICGLSLGNHVSSIFFVAFGIVLLIVRARNIIPHCILAGLIGVSIFAYVPIRSQQPLALNTSNANSFERFWMLVTDARDRALKPAIAPKIKSSLALTLRKDFNKLQFELGLVLLGVALIGAALMLKIKPVSLLALIFLALSNWYFFRGWESDPWLILCAIIIILASIACAALPKKLDHCAALLLVVCVLFNSRSELKTIALASQAPDAMHKISAVELSKAPYGALYLTENSWFPWRYLTLIEGVRDDVVLAYQPRILFPHFFEPFSIEVNGEKIFDSWNLDNNDTPVDQANFTKLGQLLNSASQYQALLIEPSIILHAFLAESVQLTDQGSVRMRPGENFNIEAEYFDTRLANYEVWRSALQGLTSVNLLGARLFIESKLVSEASLLDVLSLKQEVLDLYQNWCTPRAICSPIVLHNMILYLQQLGEADLAAGELRNALEIYPNSQTLRRLSAG